jgi:hypothetical protein
MPSAPVTAAMTPQQAYEVATSATRKWATA